MTRVHAEVDNAPSNLALVDVTSDGTIAIEGLIMQKIAGKRKAMSAPYRFCWFLIAAYHLVNAAFILLLGAVQVFISRPAVYANIWLINIDQRNLILGGWSLIAVAIAHLIALGQNIVQSILQRRLTFGRDDACQGQKDLSKKSGSIIKIVRLPAEWMKRLIGERGLFGVYGEYFYVGFYIRQAVEIAMQTYQAYQFSLSISRDWINGLVMAVITTNCTFVPVVNYWLRQYPGRRCAVLLTIDLLLDFLVLVFIPLVSMIPYAFQFDWAAGRYDPTYTYDDVWITTIIAEVRQGMISSELDYVSTLFPHVTGLLALDTIKGLVEHALEHDGNLKSQYSTSSPTTKSSESKRGKVTKLVRVTARMFYAYSFGWLVFTFSSHGTAQLRHPISSSGTCVLRGNAWFTTRDTCFVAEVNCYEAGIQGNEAEVAVVLEPLETSTVSRLIISHCPALQVPRKLTEFSSLVSVEIFNSTIVDWPGDSALTHRTTPQLSQVHLLATNFSRFPSALLQLDLPRHLGLIIYESNMTEFPDDVGAAWESHEWQHFQIEYTMLKALPPSFARVRSARFSFVYNELSAFEDSVFASSTVLTSLRLSGSNVTSLPDVTGSLPKLYQVIADDTNIATLPSWFEPWMTARRNAGKQLSVSFQSSPLCENTANVEVCGALSDGDHVDFRFDLTMKYRAL